MYCKAIVIKTVSYWHKVRRVDQWRTETTNINPYIHGRLIFGKVTTQFNKETMVFSINGPGTIGYAHAKNEVGPLLIPYETINANCVKDLTLRTKTIKLLEENIGINLDDFEVGNGFSGTISTAKVTEKKKKKKRKIVLHQY